MIDRVVRRYLLFLACLATIAVFIIAAISCSTDSPGPTGTTIPAPVGVATPAATEAVAPQPAGTPAPGADLSYIEFGAGGAGKFCALPKGGTTAYLSYTKPLDLSVIYGHYEVTAAVGTCTWFAEASKLVQFPWCGDRPIQIDANQSGYLAGRHLGHIMLDVAGGNCPGPTPTPTPSPSPCAPVWIEQPPVYTYGDWSRCTPGLVASCVNPPLTCSQERTVRTVVKEKNSCTGDERVKTDETTTEKRPCDCFADGVCHVSNKGGKDGQVNLVLTWKRSGAGHEAHLDPTKFCPPDHLGECSCEKAIADAVACGVPASGGFVCKIEGD